MAKTTRVNFDIDEDIHFQAKEIALKRKKTIKELYTKWILDGIEKETNQTRFDENAELKQS